MLEGPVWFADKSREKGGRWIFYILDLKYFLILFLVAKPPKVSILCLPDIIYQT